MTELNADEAAKVTGVYVDLLKHREVLYFQQVKYFTSVIFAIFGLCGFLLSDKAEVSPDLQRWVISLLCMLSSLLSLLSLLVLRGLAGYVDDCVEKRKALEDYIHERYCPPELRSRLQRHPVPGQVRTKIRTMFLALCAVSLGLTVAAYMYLPTIG